MKDNEKEKENFEKTMTRMKKTSDEIESFVAKFDAVKDEIEENNKKFGQLKMDIESKKLQTKKGGKGAKGGGGGPRRESLFDPHSLSVTANSSLLDTSKGSSG